MTLANWGGVKAELLADTNRAGDAVFNLRLPRFLQSALQRVHLGSGAPLPSDPVRVRAMITTASVVLTDGVGTIPDGFLEAERLKIPTEPATYPTYVEPHLFWAARSTDASGYSDRYTIEGGTITISPALSLTASLTYYGKFATPSDDADTNWLMTNAPSVLFDALRIEAYQYLRNPEMVQTAFASYASAVSGLTAHDTTAKASGGPLFPRLVGVV